MSDPKTDLITVDDLNAAVLFSGKGDGLDSTIDYIREQVVGHVPDLETDKGRKAIASLARKVARSKTLLDDLGKTLVADQKAALKKIDQERKRCRDDLDALRDEVRKPLTDWEQAKADELAEHARIFKEKEEAELRAREEAAAAILAREQELAEREARLAAEEQDRATRAAREEREAQRLAVQKAQDEAAALRRAEEQRLTREHAAAMEKKREEEKREAIAKDEKRRAQCIADIESALGAFVTVEAGDIAQAIVDGEIPRVHVDFTEGP